MIFNDTACPTFKSWTLKSGLIPSLIMCGQVHGQLGTRLLDHLLRVIGTKSKHTYLGGPYGIVEVPIENVQIINCLSTQLSMMMYKLIVIPVRNCSVVTMDPTSSIHPVIICPPFCSLVEVPFRLEMILTEKKKLDSGLLTTILGDSHNSLAIWSLSVSALNSCICYSKFESICKEYHSRKVSNCYLDHNYKSMYQFPFTLTKFYLLIHKHKSMRALNQGDCSFREFYHWHASLLIALVHVFKV